MKTQIITALPDGPVAELPEGVYDTGRRRCAALAFNYDTLTPERNVPQAYKLGILPLGRKIPPDGTGFDVAYYREDGRGVVQAWCKL